MRWSLDAGGVWPGSGSVRQLADATRAACVLARHAHARTHRITGKATRRDAHARSREAACRNVQ